MIVKILILVIFLLLYLRIGVVLFDAAIRSLGGKETYLQEIDEKYNDLNPNLLYFSGLVLVVLFWPYFLIRGGRKK